MTLWLAEEEKRYTTTYGTRLTANGLWLAEEEKRYTTLKRTKSTNNIQNYSKYATNNQGAKLVLFQFDIFNGHFANEIKKLQQRGIHGYYFVTGIEEIHKF